MKHSPPNRKRPPAVSANQSQIIMRGAKTRAENRYSLGGMPRKDQPRAITMPPLPWDAEKKK